MLSRNLAFSGLVLIACFILLPRVIFGSAYADMRLVPYMLAIFVLAIRFKAETVYPLARILAFAGSPSCSSAPPAPPPASPSPPSIRSAS